MWFHFRGKIVKRSLAAKLSSDTFGIANYRNKEHVVRTYNKRWESAPWPSTDRNRSKKEIAYAEWDGKGLTVAREGLPQMHLERMMHAIACLKPRRVLEVGAGMGRNLLPMSVCFPEVEFTGLELTQAGVDRVHAVQKQQELPDEIVACSAFEVRDKTAHRRIRFLQGDATNMPFEDNSFDLVFSHAALEQMELVRDKALSEIVRVSAHGVLTIEPFADFNKRKLLQLAIRAKNYFTLSVEELKDFNLEPHVSFMDWPQNLGEGLGLVYSTVRKD